MPGPRGDGMFNVHDFTITRPAALADKRGTSGRQIKLRANYSRIGYVEDTKRIMIHQHHIDYSPPVDSKFKRMHLMERRLLEMGFPKEAIVCDGMILYLPSKLASDKEGDVKKFVCPAGEENLPHQVEITVTWTKELPPNSAMCLTVLNLINRKILSSLDYKQYGRNFFNPNCGQRCDQFSLLVWPGFVSSIRMYEDELLMNVEQAHKVIRNVTVLDLLREIMRNNPSSFQTAAAAEITGQVVMTMYNNKTYKVDEIVYDKNPLSTFERNGVATTFKDYYLQQYQMTITEDSQCLLLSRAQRKIGQQESQVQEDVYLIPELCYLTGLTDAQRANRKLMQALSDITRLNPARRVDVTTTHLMNMARSEACMKQLNAWGLTVDRGLAPITGRQLEPETLLFGNNAPVKTTNGDWTRTSKNTSCLRGVALPDHKWVMVYPDQEHQVALKLFQTLQRVGQRQKIQVDLPECVRVRNASAQEFVAGIRHGVGQVKTNQQTDAVFVLIVVPNDSKDRYDAIKKECCIDCPVPSQVVLVASAKRENILESIATKILVQMNCKLGGVPWKVDNKFKKLVMHVGYDSYHDSSMRGKSVGAATFTTDKDWSQWYTAAKVHGEGQELIQNLHNFFLEAFEAFQKKNNGSLPDRIFLWRDGVGEGQIPVVYSIELPQIISALNKVYQVDDESALREKVKFTFTIVTKKVNSRMFLEVGSQENPKFDNPPPGTVVDSVITRKERYDFYLIPQPVNQGTVTPVSYNIIFDTNELGPDKMQLLAFKLCHLYYNWQGTIRVPAPCMYAYKAAFLVAQSLHSPIHPQLADKLIFL